MSTIEVALTLDKTCFSRPVLDGKNDSIMKNCLAKIRNCPFGNLYHRKLKEKLVRIGKILIKDTQKTLNIYDSRIV